MNDTVRSVDRQIEKWNRSETIKRSADYMLETFRAEVVTEAFPKANSPEGVAAFGDRLVAGTDPTTVVDCFSGGPVLYSKRVRELERFVMKRVQESLEPGRHSLDRRAFVQLATTFGLSLSLPSLAAKAPAAPLTADDLILIGEVSELIIPATDTGGALAAGVPAFVKMMLSDWFTATERENFIAGMQEFSAGALKKHGKKFGELTASQKDQYFGGLLAAAEGGQTAPRTPFVVLMKRLTIFGYYTSELGATTELHQHIATAQYEPAAVVKPGDRADSGLPGAMYWFNAS